MLDPDNRHRTWRDETESAATPSNWVRQLGLVAAATAAFALVQLADPVSAYDGGISASSGTFIRHGLVPYRDFWLLYGPLSGYLVAAALLVFPPTVALLRLLGVGAITAQALAGYSLIREQTTPVVAVAVATLASVAPVFFIRPDVSAWSVAMAAALAALAVARSRGRWAPFASGVLAGVAFASRLDVGGYVLLALILVHRRPAALAGFAVVAVPLALVAVSLVPAPALWEQLIWYPLVGTRTFRSISVDTSLTDPYFVAASIIVGWLPRVAIGITGLLVALGRRRGIGALVVFALLCQLQTVGRGDHVHLAQAAGPALLLVAAWLPAHPRRRVAWALGATILALPLTILALLPLAWLTVPRSAYEQALDDAVRRTSEITGPDEPIFVGLTANRFTWTNPLLVYYLVDRPPGTSVTMYNPGVTNTDTHQQRMVAELERSGTRVAVLDAFFATTCEADNQSCRPGSSRLDDYLSATFPSREVLGDFVIATRPVHSHR